MILIESNFDNLKTDIVTEATTGEKKLFINGVFMESNKKNRNGRTYRRQEMERQVARVNEAALAGRYFLGELDHPDSLIVNLKNVSHKIVKMQMEGDDAVGRAEILQKHPSGQIAKALIESGIVLGVSSRASGSVNESDGMVEDFNLVTCDLVANPSAINAYPSSVYEHLMNYRRGDYVSELAEAAIHDKAAQKYFTKEIIKFINECLHTK